MSDEAVIGMHNTSSSASVLVANLTAGNPTGASLPLFARSQREHQLYQLSGVGLGLLYEPQNRIRTVCVKMERTDPRTAEAVVDIASEFDVWLPTSDQLKQYGVEFSGNLPGDLNEAVFRFRTAVGSDSPTPKFVQAAGALQPLPDLLLKRVPAC